MAYATRLPLGFRPVPKVAFCSNVLQNVEVPLAVDDQPVLLIGQEDIPLIWLKAPASPQTKEWVFVISANRSAHPAVEVQVILSSRLVRVLTAGIEVLVARSTGPEAVAVDHLDLRPLGLDVHGDGDALFLGGTVLSSNVFEGIPTAFALSTRP